MSGPSITAHLHLSATSTYPTMVAAGDISPKVITAQKATSELVLRLAPTRVLALGDEQYNSGALADFRAYYNPTWGRFKGSTLPTPGNHEYNTPGASGYFQYFGSEAGPNGRGYYSRDLGGWHIISLDSSIARSSGSPQLTWLRADLAATQQRCVLAFWHHPRFGSGADHGNNPSVTPFWTALYLAHADVVLNGHEHDYERFRRQDPQGRTDSRGLREFVVGTGGRTLTQFGAIQPHSRVRIANRSGVLQLVLRPTGYNWKFVAVNGAVLDSGGPDSCH